MELLMFWQIFCSLFFLIVINADVNREELPLKADLIEWLRSKGGSFNSKLEIRRINNKDPSSILGIFAKEKIRPQELLIGIPTNAILSPGKKVEIGVLVCETVESLIKEMKLGNESFFAPYITQLQNDPSDSLPSAWSSAGKYLLLEVLGVGWEGYQILPPLEPISWIENEWYNDCKGGSHPLDEKSALLVIQRAWDDKMIPVFDIMRHRNGRWFNADSNSVHEGEDIKVRATRMIAAGEELYTSQNICEDCGQRSNNYGTGELLRDYGFVEDYPQRWFFTELKEVSVEIDEAVDDYGIPTGKLEIVEWINRKRSVDEEELIQIFQDERTRLSEIYATEFETRDEAVPEQEWDVIVQYHSAVITAVELVIDTLSVDNRCLEEGNCVISERYRNLREELGPIDFNAKIWDSKETFEFQGYLMLETIKTQYQLLNFFRDPNNSDTCFDIEDTVQICTNYRPHYHEGSVQFAARFIPSVKRVLFVGGGDSMLLHEVLKYPSLEKVVGLELDQQVTRKCFKHFGSQPHWDNEKVEWWFGDATKSLMMIPKDYFGSFDMVLVDLSETVMSFLVTNGLDIMEALSLLLNEGGIFVKNEHYIDKLSSIFEHTAQIHWYDNPTICHQSMIMGSNTIDFSKPTLTDHKVSSLWLEPKNAVKDSFDMFHDVKRNSSSLQLCKENAPEVKQTIQQNSPGIIMIIEAENANADLANVEKVKNSIVASLEKEGIKDISSKMHLNGKNAVIVFVFREGYITARTWPEKKYCSFDLHLWSSFEKQGSIKKTLLSSVDSTSGFSSFRIVAGGMFGVSTWKDDENKKGPQYTRDCQKKNDSVINSPEGMNIENIILEESMKLVQNGKASVVVICGPQDQPCHSLEALQNVDHVSKVVPFWTCSDIVDTNEYSEKNQELTLNCEKEILSNIILDETEEKFNAIVFDSSVPYAFAQILHFIFKRRSNWQKVFKPSTITVSLIKDATESWREGLMDRILKEYFIYEPIFRAKIQISRELEFHVVSNGDPRFFTHIDDFLHASNERTGLVSEVQEIFGGKYTNQGKCTPSKIWLPTDYSKVSSYEQWSSQKSLGLQTIFQLENKRDYIVPSKLTNCLEKALLQIFDYSISIYEFDNLGEGILFVAIWLGGNINILWDGRVHIDINVFTDTEDNPIADKFLDIFLTEITTLEIKLRDEQPRGIGRVVNPSVDIAPGKPHWMFVGDVPNFGPVGGNNDSEDDSEDD